MSNSPEVPLSQNESEKIDFETGITDLSFKAYLNGLTSRIVPHGKLDTYGNIVEINMTQTMENVVDLLDPRIIAPVKRRKTQLEYLDVLRKQDLYASHKDGSRGRVVSVSSYFDAIVAFSYLYSRKQEIEHNQSISRLSAANILRKASLLWGENPMAEKLNQLSVKSEIMVERGKALLKSTEERSGARELVAGEAQSVRENGYRSRRKEPSEEEIDALSEKVDIDWVSNEIGRVQEIMETTGSEVDVIWKAIGIESVIGSRIEYARLFRRKMINELDLEPVTFSKLLEGLQVVEATLVKYPNLVNIGRLHKFLKYQVEKNPYEYKSVRNGEWRKIKPVYLR